MELTHLELVGIDDQAWVFRLRRDHSFVISISKDDHEAVVRVGTSQILTDDEWIEALRLHSAIMTGEHTPPA